jgi:hypothetical protein
MVGTEARQAHGGFRPGVSLPGPGIGHWNLDRIFW